MNVFAETKASEANEISTKIFSLQYNYTFSLHYSIILPENIKKFFLW